MRMSTGYLARQGRAGQEWRALVMGEGARDRGKGKGEMRDLRASGLISLCACACVCACAYVQEPPGERQETKNIHL